MKSFYLTVGYKYAHEPHPQGLHPDGVVEIRADDYESARRVAFDTFGTKWSGLYETVTMSYYPRGVTLVMAAEV